MDGLNYHHLLYFYTVARTGTIAKASELLQLTQPTISEQVRLLENSLGRKLFEKSGRNLVLTETGKTVFEYAEKIFALGHELADAIEGLKRTPRKVRQKIGVGLGVPVLVAYRLLKPLMTAKMASVVCSQDRLEALLGKLALHEIDLVLADTPAPRSVHVNVLSHKLGECGVSFFVSESLANSHKGKFPNCLEGMAMLLPKEGAALRVSLERWFDSNRVRPEVVGEFEDSALMWRFGKAGAGVFAAPTVAEKDIVRDLGVRVLGRTSEIVERFYLISTERKLRDPAAVAIDSGRSRLFA
jgi:LysR family transcriptional regulator, transcriptional activator of nhaA